MEKKKKPIAQAAKAPAARPAAPVVPKVEAAKMPSSASAAIKAVKQTSLAVKKESVQKREPETEAPVLDLKARLMLKMAASAAASSGSGAPVPVPAAVAVAAPRVRKAAPKHKTTLDLCSDESEVEGSTLRGLDSLSLESSKPLRKPQIKKTSSRSYDDDESSSEGEQMKKPKAVRKPRAPAIASGAGSKVQGVKRPKKATGARQGAPQGE